MGPIKPPCAISARRSGYRLGWSGRRRRHTLWLWLWLWLSSHRWRRDCTYGHQAKNTEQRKRLPGVIAIEAYLAQGPRTLR